MVLKALLSGQGYVRRQLSLLLVATALLSALIVGGFSYLFAQNLSTKYALNVSHLAEEAMDQVERQFTKLENTLHLISQDALFSDISVTTPNIEAISVSERLAEIITSHGSFTRLIVTNREGLVLATETPGSELIGSRVNDEFLTLAHSTGEYDIRRERYRYSLLAGGIGGFWLHAPVYSLWNANRPIGWLSGFVPGTSMMGRIEGSMIDGQPQDATRYFVLLRDDGQLVQGTALPPLSELALDTNLFERFPELGQWLSPEKHSDMFSLDDGNSHKIVGHAESALLALRVIAFVDDAVVYRQIKTLRHFLLAFLALIVVLSLVAATLISRRFTTPLLDLLSGVQRIAAGDLEHRVAITTNNEFAELTRAFNTMTAELGEAFAVVSEQNRALQTAERKYRGIFENAVEGIFQSSIDGRLLTANPALARMLGYSSVAELLAEEKSIAEMFYADPADRKRLIDALREHGVVTSFEVDLKQRNGHVFSALINGTFIAGVGGDEDALEGTIQDISEKKEREQALQEKLAAQSASEAKSAFLASMSHELRTPMNAIIGMSELALDSELNHRQYNYISKVHASAEYLLGILDDILDFSKIEAHRLKLEQIDFKLSTVVERLHSMLDWKAQEKGVELRVELAPELPSILHGDPIRLGQILINLTNNAIKFSPQGEVSVRISATEAMQQDSVLLHITVRDEGIGMSREQLDKLFSPFIQADSSTSRLYGGTGLGLAICKELCELMGGEIRAQSEPDRGSQFDLKVPFGIGQAVDLVEPDQQLDALLTQLRGARILVVEDNDLNLELAFEMLSRNGIRVTPARNGREALELLNHGPFDGVLMDIQMPVMDGYTATREIRRQTRLHDLPIIAMTANVMLEDLEKAHAAGMNDHIGKPFNLKRLLHTLARWIRARHPVDPSGSTPQYRAPVTDASHLPAFEHIGGIDTAAGLAGTQYDAQLYRSLLQLYLKEAEGFVEHFRRACQSQETDEALRIAHTLNGQSGAVHADGVRAAAKELEDVCRNNGEPAEIERALQQVTSELDPILASLRRLFATSEGTTTIRLDPPALTQLLEQLREFLVNDDPQALEKVVALEGNMPESEYAALRQAVDACDFPAALTLLQVKSQ